MPVSFLSLSKATKRDCVSRSDTAFQTYDGMIAASALRAGCDTLWSEDMQHGMVLEEGLRIVKPFRASS